MKQGNNKNRNRGYNNRNNGNPNRNRSNNIPSKNQVLESSGPSGKIRGNLMQLVEKYLSAGKDASSQDDIVLAESCYQYADHYVRLLNLANAADNNNNNNNNNNFNRRDDQQQRNSQQVEIKTPETEQKSNTPQPEEQKVPTPIKEDTSEQVANIAFLNREIKTPSEEAPVEAPKKKRIVRTKKVKEIASDATA